MAVNVKVLFGSEAKGVSGLALWSSTGGHGFGLGLWLLIISLHSFGLWVVVVISLLDKFRDADICQLNRFVNTPGLWYV